MIPVARRHSHRSLSSVQLSINHNPIRDATIKGLQELLELFLVIVFRRGDMICQADKPGCSSCIEVDRKPGIDVVIAYARPADPDQVSICACLLKVNRRTVGMIVPAGIEGLGLPTQIESVIG